MQRDEKMKLMLVMEASPQIITSTSIIHEAQKKDWKTRNIKIKLERLNNPFGDGQASQKIVTCT